MYTSCECGVLRMEWPSLTVSSLRKLLTSTPAGLRLCISFFDRMASLFEAEDAADSSQAFDVGCVS